jgi:hypothetical protein
MDAEDAENNNYVAGNSSPGLLACTGHEHYAIQVVDEVFHINIDDIFTLIFTDNPLFQEFLKARNTYDVNLASWSETPDENGIKTRFISYTLSINYSIGPKCSPSSEQQKLLPESQPGLNYLVDAECYNGGVPYADDFFTTIRYCITRIADDRCRLRISGQVTYKKHIWGLIKTFIDKTANTGLATSFGVMAGLLRKESERRKTKSENRQLEYTSTRLDDRRTLPPNHRPYPPVKGHAKEKTVRHRKRHAITGSTYADTTKRRLNAMSGKEDVNFSTATDLLAKSVFIVVLFLVFVNLALFYQITSLETTVAKAITKYSFH